MRRATLSLSLSLSLSLTLTLALALACTLILGVRASLAQAPSAEPATTPTRLAAALPVTYSIASALAAGTPIEVRLVPDGGRRMNQLPSYFERRVDELAAELADIDAVVTIGKLWDDDPLYTVARLGNIRVIDIDATKPWSLSLEGIAVASEPASDVPWVVEQPTGAGLPSTYYWQSPVNGARSADIIASDLMRLRPDAADRIEQNLAAFRTDMLALQSEYQLMLAELPDLTVAALAAEFVYLTNAFGIYVDSYFLKQDIDWTPNDLEAYSAYLGDNDITVVIHKWEPDESIAAAIAAGGAELVVLDPIDLGIEVDEGIATDSYQRLLRSNLAALHDALNRAR